MRLPGDKTNGLIEDLGAIMGMEASLRLLALYGGSSLYVPLEVTCNHPLALVLGLRPFQRFVDEYGGEVLSVPANTEYDRLRRVRKVVRLLHDGVDVNEIARRLEITPRHVRNLRRQGALWKLG